MKKHSLFKVILIVFGVLLLVNGGLAVAGQFVDKLNAFKMVPLGDTFINFTQSFYYFFDAAVYLLVIGAFYGVLKEVPAYKKLIDNIASKVKSHSKLFVIIITILFALLTSFTGLIGAILIFVPFVAAIVLALGYDKLVAITSTVVSMLVGFIGGVYVTFRDPNNYYGYGATTIEKLSTLDLYSNIWAKLVLLVLGTALLVFFITRYIKNLQDKKVKYELNESNEVLVSEVKGDYKNIKTWPMIVILSVILVILVLGYLPWNSLFGIECFDKFNDWLLGLKIGEFSVFSNVITANAYSLGNWASLGSYMAIIITLIIFTLIIKFVYRIKFDDVIDNFMNGAKKMIPTVFLVMITYAILVCAYNFGFMSNIISLISESKLGLNVLTGTLISGLGTLLHTDLYYTVAGVYSTMIAQVTDESLYSVYAVLFQSVYGIVSIIGPTSFLVIFALKYFDVPYTTWVKYIWRFVLMLLLIVILVLLVMSLI